MIQKCEKSKQLLTYSRAQSFKKCRRRHYLEYEWGFRRMVDAKALRMGSAGHLGLHLLKQGLDLEKAIAKALQTYTTCPEGLDTYDWMIERETIANLLRGYAWRWQDYPLEIVASELPFQLPLSNPQSGHPSTLFRLAGKLDGIVRLEDGRLAVQEHKFVSDPIEEDSNYWRRLQLDAQPTIYTWAARLLDYDSVCTVLYDIIRKPSIRPEKVPLLDENGFKIVLDGDGRRVVTKQGKPRQTGSVTEGYVLQTRPQTPEEWGVKLLEDISQDYERYFARHEIARLDADVEETLSELWDLQRTLRDAERHGRWYRTVDRDTCGFCPFFGLCSSSFKPVLGVVPEGFVRLENIHPELE